MGMSGIKQLIVLAQTKQTNANEAALEGADKQRALIKKMKDLRAQKSALEDKLLDKTVTGTEESQIRDLISDAQASGDLDASGLDIDFQGDGRLGAEGTEAENQDLADALVQKFDDALKDLEAQDKLGNFEIQDLMSTFNQAQTLASSVQKKLDDTESAVIGKI